MAKDVLGLIASQRSAAEKRDARAWNQIIKVYQRGYNRIADKLEGDLNIIWNQGGDNVSKVWVTKKLTGLREMTNEELSSFSKWLGMSIPAFATDAILSGGEHSAALMRFMMGTKLETIDFAALPDKAIGQMLTFLETGSPLYERINLIAPYYTDKIVDKLVDGIVLGYGPRKTAGNIAPLIADITGKAKDAFANPMADALRLTRTTQLWSYREATRQNYLEHPDVITGWQWSSALDGNTCMSCVVLDGKIFPLDTKLDDHYNGRCAMIPVILGESAMPEMRGQDWFNSLSAEEQAAMMGAGKYDLWQQSKIELDDLSIQINDDVWGTMRTVPTLESLIPKE